MTLVAPHAIQGPQSPRSYRPCPIREERARWTAQAARDGYSLDEIAAALGVSKTRVCTTLTSMGIRRRRPNREALHLERLGAGRWGGKSPQSGSVPYGPTTSPSKAVQKGSTA